MGFKKTSEGRVFFKNPDNDDLPATPVKQSAESPISKNNTQMQILLLLKSLNGKLQDSREDNAEMKETLDGYKETIKLLEDKTTKQHKFFKSLEEKTTKQQNDYIDLEQKVAEKQNQASKKSTRVENSIKTTLQQLEEAKDLVKLLEEKSESQDKTLKNIKKEIKEKIESQGHKTEGFTDKQGELFAKQEKLEARQKDQGEKMVSNVAAYVALTKRVADTETQQEALDNKIEDSSSDYLKLDRKIDKVIEDRNRILRKIERIEQAVLETRDALNAKAMVLLTDQGAVAGVNSPIINDGVMETDPMVLKRRLEEQAMMPWWRRSVQLHATSLALLMVLVMLLGWIISAANTPTPSGITSGSAKPPPTITLGSSDNDSNGRYATEPSQNNLVEANSLVMQEENFAETDTPDFTLAYNNDDNYNYADEAIATAETDSSPSVDSFNAKTTNSEPAHGITIHKGYNDPAQINKKAPVKAELDINNDAQMLAAMETDPESVARRLNQIEPSSLVEEVIAIPVDPVEAAPIIIVDQAYKASLKRRISSDNRLSDVAKKIETQAFEGVPEAQHDMGAIYVAGHGKIKPDLKRAVFWFREAADNGIGNAKYNLGVLYHQGLGVDADLDKAISLYKEAADSGHAEAQYNLGIANIEGIGVPYNPGNAAQYFEKAANQGVVEAAYNLGLIHENGLLGEAQPDIALTWYKHAADKGSPEAQSAMEQLALSIGVGIDDISRIIENVRRSHTSFSDAQDKQSLISRTQGELMRRGLYPGPVDGVLGPMTRSAIEGFQKSANLQTDGEPSIELLQYLKASSNYSQYQ